MHGPTRIYWANLTPFSLQPAGYRYTNQEWALRMLNSVGTESGRGAFDHNHGITKYVRAGTGRAFKALAGLLSAEGEFLMLNLTETRSPRELQSQAKALMVRARRGRR